MQGRVFYREVKCALRRIRKEGRKDISFLSFSFLEYNNRTGLVDGWVGMDLDGLSNSHMLMRGFFLSIKSIPLSL